MATPFTGDQALFTVFGRQLARGDALYVDLWDLKQPALFWWYRVAGGIGGFDAVGIHLVEAAYLVGFAALMPRLLRGHLSDRAAAVAPALSIGVYFLTAEAIDLGQAEVIGGPVVFLAAWLGALAEPDQRGRLVAAGVAIGLAGAVKLTLVPLAAVPLLVPICWARPPGSSPWRRAVPVLGWAALGVAVPVAVVLVRLLATGGLEPALQAWFEVAPEATGEAGRPLGRLARSLARFAAMFAPVVLLAGAGTTRLWRERPTPRLLLAMGLWIAAAVPVFLVQHWWRYLPQMVVLPLGVLAAAGLGVVAGWWRGGARPRRLLVAVGAAATALTVVSAAPRWADLLRHDLGVTASGRAGLEAEVPAYVRGEAFAEQVDVEGPVFVLGDPIVLLESGREPGIPTNGWLPEQMDADLWDQVADELEEEQPPLLVVNDFGREIMEAGAPGTAAVIEEGWCRIGGVDTDRWYARRDLRACTGG